MFLSDKRKRNDILTEAYEGLSETHRVKKVTENTRMIVDNLDEQFCRQTELTKTDVVFLFTAIGLQIARQYLLTKFPERIDNQLAAKKTWFHNEEHSDRKHRYYNPSLEEIITNPVPFVSNKSNACFISSTSSLDKPGLSTCFDLLFIFIYFF